MPRAVSLNAKQTRFCAEYLQDLNGSAAAVRAGYSPTRARATAAELLAMPHIRAEVARLEGQNLARIGVTAEGVIEQLRRIAFFDVRVIYDDCNEMQLVDCKCLACQTWERKELFGKGSKSHGPRPHDPQLLSVTVKRMKHPADWPAEARTALSSYDTVVRNLTAGDGMVDAVLKVKLESKLQALELLAKHLGLLNQPIEQTTNVTITWLPPEPVPTTIDVTPTAKRLGAPSSSPGPDDADGSSQGRMGSPAPPGAPSHRAPLPVVSESDQDDTAELGNSGLSRKAQERMFPELRRERPRV